MQITQERTARAEIVEAEFDAEDVQVIDHRNRLLAIFHYATFRIFQYQAVQIEVCEFGSGDLVGQIGLCELFARQIDANG